MSSLSVGVVYFFSPDFCLLFCFYQVTPKFSRLKQSFIIFYISGGCLSLAKWPCLDLSSIIIRWQAKWVTNKGHCCGIWCCLLVGSSTGASNQSNYKSSWCGLGFKEDSTFVPPGSILTQHSKIREVVSLIENYPPNDIFFFPMQYSSPRFCIYSRGWRNKGTFLLKQWQCHTAEEPKGKGMWLWPSLENTTSEGVSLVRNQRIIVTVWMFVSPIGFWQMRNIVYPHYCTTMNSFTALKIPFYLLITSSPITQTLCNQWCF